jgi:DNA-binding beta-propeller fold protein YncE
MRIRYRSAILTLAFGLGASLSAFGQTLIDTVDVGPAPRAVVVNTVTNKIYVGNWAGHSVTVIDGVTDNTEEVGVPQTDVLGLAVNQVTNKIYVTDDSTDAFTVIDGTTLSTTSVTVAPDAWSVAVNPITNKIYAPSTLGYLTIIDGLTLQTTTLNPGGDLTTVAVNPVTNKIYVGDDLLNRVTVVDGVTLSTETVTVATNGTSAIAVNSATNKIYVAQNPMFGGNTVTVIDGLTLATTSVTVGQYPVALAINSRTNKIYVACQIGVVTVIDGATNQTTDVPAGVEPFAVSVDESTDKIYAVNGQSNDMTVIDGQSLSAVTIKVGHDPTAVATNPATNRVYVTNYGDDTASVIDGTPRTRLLSVSKAGTGHGLVSGGSGQIYCGSVCSHQFDIGTQVSLSALPDPGNTFTGWAGCDNVNGSYCSMTMTSAKSVTATFDSVSNITLTSLTFKPSYVRGGQLSAGTLSLNRQAPPGGLTVALSSDHPGVAHPPSFVFIPGGKSSVGFAVQTFPVKSNTTVTITATAGSSQVSGTLMVGTTSLPPSIK